MPRVLEFDETFQAEAVEAAQLPTGAEAYFCGDEGWQSTCYPALGTLSGNGLRSYVMGFAAYELVNTFVGNPETFGDYSAANKAGLILAGISLLMTTKHMLLDSRADHSVYRSEGETDYAILSGRKPLPTEN